MMSKKGDIVRRFFFYMLAFVLIMAMGVISYGVYINIASERNIYECMGDSAIVKDM